MTMQDFTSDPDKIKVAIDKINPAGNSTKATMIDAVESSVRMLEHRPKNNRDKLCCS